MSAKHADASPHSADGALRVARPAIQIGLCLAAFGGQSLEEALLGTARHGNLCFDLPTDTSLGLVDGLRCAHDAAYREEIAGRVARSAAAGSRVSCVSNSRDTQLLLGPHGKQTDQVLVGSAAEKREHALACGLGAIELARALGVGHVRLQLGCPDHSLWLSWWGSEASWQDNVNALLDEAAPLIRAAREAHVRLLLEPHPKQVVYDALSAAALFAASGQNAGVIGLCIDPANLAAMGQPAAASLRHLSRYLVSVHAKDLERWSEPSAPRGPGWGRYGPQPPIRFRALGHGCLDWPGMVAALVDLGFEGIVYVEHEDATLPRHQSIEQSLRVLRACVPCGVADGRTW